MPPCQGNMGLDKVRVMESHELLQDAVGLANLALVILFREHRDLYFFGLSHVGPPRNCTAGLDFSGLDAMILTQIICGVNSGLCTSAFFLSGDNDGRSTH